MKQMVIAGNPVKGFTYVGPFDDVYAAQDWAEQNEVRYHWWIAELLDPSGLGAPMVTDHRGMWGEISEALDADMADLDAVDGDMDLDPDPEPVTSVLDLIIKAESEGLDSETEFYAYIWVLVDSGLVNSTGSNQRLVADFANTHGDGWKVVAREGFKQLFSGATNVHEAGL